MLLLMSVPLTSCSLPWWGGLGTSSCCPNPAIRFVRLRLAFGSSCWFNQCRHWAILAPLFNSPFYILFFFISWAKAQSSPTQFSSYPLWFNSINVNIRRPVVVVVFDVFSRENSTWQQKCCNAKTSEIHKLYKEIKSRPIAYILKELYPLLNISLKLSKVTLWMHFKCSLLSYYYYFFFNKSSVEINDQLTILCNNNERERERERVCKIILG